MNTITKAMIRGGVIVSETARGSEFDKIMTAVGATQPIISEIETEIIARIETPSAEEGVESLHDQQYTMKRVAAPDRSMMIHSANPVCPVKGDTWKI